MSQPGSKPIGCVLWICAALFLMITLMLASELMKGAKGIDPQGALVVGGFALATVMVAVAARSLYVLGRLPKWFVLLVGLEIIGSCTYFGIYGGSTWLIKARFGGFVILVITLLIRYLLMKDPPTVVRDAPPDLQDR